MSISKSSPSHKNIRLFTTNLPGTPVPKKDRISYLDILRGIAILFIFIANIRYLSGEYFISELQKTAFATTSLDYLVEIFAFMLVDGKFYSIFSILFGIGFAVQYHRMGHDDKVFVPFFRKRMLGLLLIGTVHLFLIWLGDILTLYALIGFVLIWFRKFSDKRLLLWSAILLLMPVVHFAIMYLTDTFYPKYLFALHDQLSSRAMINMLEGENNFTKGAYISITSLTKLIELNLIMPLLRFGSILIEGRIFKVLALFLLGIYAGRQILEHHILSNNILLKKILTWGLVIGLPMNLLRTWVEFSHMEGIIWEFATYLLNALALAPMAAAYCALIALLVTRRPAWLKWFSSVGRTALSNYLFQSLISIYVFYGVGLGYGLSFGYSIAVLFALVVFSWQIIFSTLWLGTFRFGPVEWIWRQLTYGKMIKLRKPVPKATIKTA